MRFTSYAIMVVLVFAGARRLDAQATDFDGLITSSNWLILGPFANPYGCNGNNASLLGNHVAPSFIGCMYPEEGDDIDYDPADAVSTGYLGPDVVPIWRRFDDFSDDGDQNLDADLGGDLSDVMSWMVTYVEYGGDAPTIVDLCIGSDDGVQVWIDDQLVHNNNACRGRAVCQDTASAVITPGIHRIAIAAWERAGGWGLSLGLRQGGRPITDDGTWPDWVFLGTESDGYTGPPGCEEPQVVVERVANLTCSSAAGGVTLSWQNPPGAPANEPISIAVGGTEVGTAAGDETSFVVPLEDAPAGSLVCVTNAGGFAACCVVPLAISCEKNADGSVTIDWENPAGQDPNAPIAILVNDEESITVAGDQTRATVPAGDLPEEGFARLCVQNQGLVPPCCLIAVNNIVRINMGGEETIDSEGRLWLGDRPCGLPENADPLGIRPDTSGGTRAICDWCAPNPESMEKLGLDPLSLEDAHIFSTIRWDEGGDGVNDFFVEFPIDNGVYDVNLYFCEQCCTGRHFKIDVQGVVEYADVSYLSYDPVPALDKVGLLEVKKAQVTDGTMRIGFLPCPECPGATDNNAIINAIEVLPSEGDPCADAPLARVCATGLECTLGANGAVTGSWQTPPCGEPTGYTVLKDGVTLVELPGDATGFTDTLDARSAIYTLVTTLPGGAGPCATVSCSLTRTDVPFEVPLRINMGGEEIVDSSGRLWLGDRPCSLPENADPLGIRRTPTSGTRALCNWCETPDAATMERLNFDPLSPEDAHIFSTIRWDEGGDGIEDFFVDLPVPNGEYDINLYFCEDCCTGRHFKVQVQDEIEFEDVSYLNYDELAPALNKAGVLVLTEIPVDNGVLSLGFLPCPECPNATDNNAIISGIEVIPSGIDPCENPAPGLLCASGFQCSVGANGAVTGSWSPPECGVASGYEVLKNGATLVTLPADVTQFTDTLDERFGTYELVTLREAGADPCRTLRCSLARTDIPFSTPLRINMGGRETVDSRGDTWLGDGPGSGDPLGIRPDDLGGANWIENWSPANFQPDSLEALGWDPTHPGDVYIFDTIRWDDGNDLIDFRLEIPIADGEYTVNMYFNEGCCVNRHFKIELEEEIVDDDVSYLDYDPQNPALGRVGRLSFEEIEVVDGILDIVLLPCFECPGGGDGNAIIDALEILGLEPEGPVFHRGDANDDGRLNIADALFILTDLFAGGADPTCREATDVNDDGIVNLADPVALLSFLFGGAGGAPAPPAPPGPPPGPCGPDPAGSVDLGCESYTNC